MGEPNGGLNSKFTFTFSTLNHEDVTGEVTITQQEETKEYSATYIPMRTIRILKRNTTIFIPNATVKIGDETYTANAVGQVQIRKNVSLNGTVEANDYNDGTFDLEAIVDDTTNVVYLDPQAVVTFTVRDEKNMLLSGATVMVGGKSANTNSSGVGEIALKQGTYTYTTKYQDYFAKGEITIALHNLSVNVTVSLDITTLIPEENGNIQMLLVGTSCKVEVTSPNTNYEINWGDGTTENASATGYKSYTHTYVEDGYHNIEIWGCEEITSAIGATTCLAAYWSIGNSKVNNLTFSYCSKLVHVGDVFKNDKDRTSLGYLFSNCGKLNYANFSSMAVMTEVTTMQGAFEYCGLRIVLSDFAHFTKVTNVSEMLRAYRYPEIDLSPISGWINVVNAEGMLMDNRLEAIDLNPIASWTNVTNIDMLFSGINSAKIKIREIDLSFIRNMVNLTRIRGLLYNFINLSNPADIDFSPLLSLPNLRSLTATFTNSTIETADVSFLNHIPGLISINGYLQSCSKLKTVIGLEELNIDNITDVGSFMNHCSTYEGKLPEWWINAYGRDINKNYCFSGCTRASNWQDVPKSWGGPGPEWYPPFTDIFNIKILKDSAWWLNQTVSIKGTILTQLADGSYSARLTNVKVNDEVEVVVNGSPQGVIYIEYQKTDYTLLIGDNSALDFEADYTTGDIHQDSVVSNDGWAYDQEVGGLRSRKITSNQTTSFIINVPVGETTITYGQNSEYSYDYCTIYTGTEVKLIDLKGSTCQGDNLTLNIKTTGNLKFSYHKDGSSDTGKDAFWIKKITGAPVLPPLPEDFVPTTPSVSGAMIADYRALNARVRNLEEKYGIV